MKKTLIAILMAMLVLPVFALTARAEDDNEDMTPTLYTQEAVSVEMEEEKIPNPEEIKNFMKIRRIGNSLYGVRRVYNTANNRPEGQNNKPGQGFQMMDDQREDDRGEMMNNTTEEKILSLDDVKYFTKIRKIGASLYGVRIKNQTATVISADALACVKTALTKKDNAVLAAFDAYAAAARTAMTTRNAAQLAALDITVSADRAKAMNAAMIANKKAKDEANRLRNQSVKAANDTYKTDLKACRVNIGADLDTSDVDSSL